MDTDLDKFFPTTYEDLVSGSNDWKNIQDVIRNSMKGVIDAMRFQERSIKELTIRLEEKADKIQVEADMDNKAGIEEVRRALDHVADMLDEKVSRDFLSQLLENYVSKAEFERDQDAKITREEFERSIEDKVEVKDFRESFSMLKGTMDDFMRETKGKLVSFANYKEMSDLRDELESKANFEDMRKILEDKASKAETEEILSRKIDIDDLESIIEKKVDVTDFEQLLSLVDRKAEQNYCDHIFEIVESKSDKGEMDHIMGLINKKAEKQESEKLSLDMKIWKSESDKWIKAFDKTCQEYKRDLLGYKGENEALIEKLNKKADRKETDRLSNVLGRKVDAERMAEEISRIKKELASESKGWKQGTLKIKEWCATETKEKNRKLEKGLEVLGEEIGNTSVELGQLRAEYAKMLDDVVKNSKSADSSIKRDLEIQMDKLAEEIAIIGKDSEKLINEKLDKKDFTDLMKDVTKSLTMKVDLDEVQASLNSCQADIAGKLIDLKDEFIKALKSQSQEVGDLLSKKANIGELKNIMCDKLDLEGADELLDRKFTDYGLDNIQNRVRKMEEDLTTRLGQKEYDAQLRFLRENIEDLQKNIVLKANFQDLCSLLDTKSNIEDVNGALKEIQHGLDDKSNKMDFNGMINEQALINEFLCTENIIARWKWKSGALRDKNFIPWEVQSINTLPDNFMWEKNESSVIVVTAGLYEVTFGLYSRKKPAAQLYINSEVIISAVNSSSYVIHHSSGKLKDVKTSKSGNPNITGLTMIDYLTIPARARISLCYSGETPGEGFLSLKRL